MGIIWQDILMMIGGFGFFAALVPSILGPCKPSRLTCAITLVILLSYTVAMGTLGLWLSCAATALTATAWGTLLIQRRAL